MASHEDSERRALEDLRAVIGDYAASLQTVMEMMRREMSPRDIDDAVKIPRSAVHQSSYVYLVENGSLQRRDVTLRRRESDSVMVSGLEAGDLLVLTRLDLMVDGMPVRMLD